ncbi:unnamed protein product [Ambrosiozyma monospora]|uniref:Unnamed protein product n=1 Tax=Ambrosiozyma monospora TaxID=43982 RepID=A0A9W6Z4T3_AMBMO|nr:unnamed protein product [Ambrosiozyma monospora]
MLSFKQLVVLAIATIAVEGYDFASQSSNTPIVPSDSLPSGPVSAAEPVDSYVPPLHSAPAPANPSVPPNPRIQYSSNPPSPGNGGGNSPYYPIPGKL